VVDGGSDDGSPEFLVRQKDTITIVQHNRGEFQGKLIQRRSWGYFMNLGFRCAQGKYILMVSDDCLLVPGALENGISFFEDRLAAGHKTGAVAFYWRDWPSQEQYRVSLVLGNRMSVNHGLYLRSALEEVGWIDEDRYRFYHADADLALRLWDAGYEVVDCPDAYVEHFEHANAQVRQSNYEREAADWKALLERWPDLADGAVRSDALPWIVRDYHDATNTAARFPGARAALAEALRKRGRAAFGKGEWQTAGQAYRSAVALNPRLLLRKQFVLDALSVCKRRCLWRVQR
jgi:GT2 family glycosyltransferase